MSDERVYAGKRGAYFAEWRKNNPDYLKDYRKKNAVSIKEKDKLRKSSEEGKKKRRDHYRKNRERLLEYQKTPKQREMRKNYMEDNKIELNKKRREYSKIRKKEDPVFLLSERMRTSIYLAVKRKRVSKAVRTNEIIGISWQDFANYIESKFESWMSWDNYGRDYSDYNKSWQIDHIIPLSKSNNIDDIVRLNHYTNLRPLCSKKNLEKSDK